MSRAAVTVAEVFRRYGDTFRARAGAALSTAQRRVMTAIEQCRTAALGGHVEQCCSASTIFAARVASFEDVTPHPQNDRTRCLGRIASSRHPGAGTRCPEHAAARGVRRRRARRSAATRASSWTAGTAPCKPGRKTIAESHGERRVTRGRDVGCGVPAGRSSPHEAPPTASVHPPRRLPGRRAGGPVFRGIPRSVT